MVTEFAGNTIVQYLVALTLFFGTALILMLAQKGILVYLARFASASHTLFDDAIIEMFRTIKPPFYWFVSFLFSLRYLVINPHVHTILNRLLVIWASVQAIIALQIFIDVIIDAKIRAAGKGPHAMVSGIMSGIAKIVLWLLVGLFVLSNLGINITSLVAGLGIGGIAIALAAQNVLGDLFSSLAIYFDRPFVLGDYIVVGQNGGTVQKIGIKSTRIRALSGEEISIPNKDIAAARISNFKRMKERRSALTLAVPYDTPASTLEKIPALLEKSIEGVEHTRCKSAFLVGMGNSAILFELVYIIDDRDFDIYLGARQQIILHVVDLFAKEGISLIPPGQTITLGEL